jgi:membrane protease YdiL (CAAX protease family)
MPSERQLSVWTAIGLWATAVASAALYGAWHGYGGRAYAVTLSILAFFLAIQILFAAGNFGERMARRTGRHVGVLFATVPFLAYLVYLAGAFSFTWARAAIAAAYTLAPILLATSATTKDAGVWQDYVAMVLIFLPLKIRILNSLWPYGGPMVATVATMLLAISLALGTFLFVRQFDGVGYNIVWGRDAMSAVLWHFGILALLLIPLGVALHFIRFDPAQFHWKSLPGDAAFIFLLTAWPEEFLFRGLLQNSLSRTFSSETGGWIAASVVFGVAHIANNGVFPNWRYALLATIAGIFYGRTWRKTNSIFTSAIVHALVDTVWHVAFRTL